MGKFEKGDRVRENLDTPRPRQRVKEGCFLVGTVTGFSFRARRGDAPLVRVRFDTQKTRTLHEDFLDVVTTDA